MLNKETGGGGGWGWEEKRGKKQPEVGLKTKTFGKHIRMCLQHQVHLSKEGYKTVSRTQRKDLINNTRWILQRIEKRHGEPGEGKATTIKGETKEKSSQDAFTQIEIREIINLFKNINST